MLNLHFSDKNVLFILFNGESFDYIGSQRIVYDMQQESFPTITNYSSEYPIPQIKLEDIDLFIELGQLSKTNAIHLHNFKEKEEVRCLKYFKGNLIIFKNFFRRLIS